jgi:hypothetical protein
MIDRNAIQDFLLMYEDTSSDFYRIVNEALPLQDDPNMIAAVCALTPVHQPNHISLPLDVAHMRYEIETTLDALEVLAECPEVYLERNSSLIDATNVPRDQITLLLNSLKSD